MLRQKFLSLVEQHFQIHKVCALLGPRQCGKTTFSRQFASLKKIPQINIFANCTAFCRACGSTTIL